MKYSHIMAHAKRINIQSCGYVCLYILSGAHFVCSWTSTSMWYSAVMQEGISWKAVAWIPEISLMCVKYPSTSWINVPKNCFFSYLNIYCNIGNLLEIDIVHHAHLSYRLYVTTLFVLNLYNTWNITISSACILGWPLFGGKKICVKFQLDRITLTCGTDF